MKLSSSSYHASTTQSPAETGVTREPASVHTLSDSDRNCTGLPDERYAATARLNAPSSFRGEPREPTLNVRVWGFLASTTCAPSSDCGRWLEVPNFNVVTKHEPAESASNLPNSILQPAAVPSAAVKETSPAPVPPDVVRTSGCRWVPDSEVNSSRLCGALPMVNEYLNGGAAAMVSVSVVDTSISHCPAETMLSTPAVIEQAELDVETVFGWPAADSESSVENAIAPTSMVDSWSA